MDECVRVEGNQADVHERLPVRVHCRDGVEADRPRGGRWFSALALIRTACDVFVILKCFFFFGSFSFWIEMDGVRVVGVGCVG